MNVPFAVRLAALLCALSCTSADGPMEPADAGSSVDTSLAMDVSASLDASDVTGDSAADTAVDAPDTRTVLEPLTCEGVLECIADFACVSLECLDACVARGTESAQVDYGQYRECLGTTCKPEPGQTPELGCVVNACFAVFQRCRGGEPTYDCEGINTCVAGCGDAGCSQACVASALDTTVAGSYVALVECVEMACPDGGNTSCAIQAQQSVCYAEAAACQADEDEGE